MFRKTDRAIVTEEEWEHINRSISEKDLKRKLEESKELNKKFKRISSEEAIRILNA